MNNDNNIVIVILNIINDDNNNNSLDFDFRMRVCFEFDLSTSGIGNTFMFVALDW